MKLGIMQPYFLPYIGYISLIKHTDQFVLLDSVQFIRHGWIERNRILKPNDGWQYIQVPLVKHSQKTLIQGIIIDNKQNWKSRILAQLQHYKKKAPYYYSTIRLLEDIFQTHFEDIVTLNHYSLIKICEYLNISCDIGIFSNMNINIADVNDADEWALNICKAMGNITEYINPIGGMTFFNKTKYDSANILLKFQKMNLSQYDQKKKIFESGLSIIDALMFCSIEEINIMLNDCDFL